MNVEILALTKQKYLTTSECDTVFAPIRKQLSGTTEQLSIISENTNNSSELKTSLRIL